MKKWIVYGAGFFSLIAGGGWWFWSLGSLPMERAAHLLLQPERGIVEVRQRSGKEWQSVRTATPVASGDTIRTGDEGLATLRLYDIGESRLASGSEVTIQDASAARIRLQLSTGRLWTRLLRSFDFEGSLGVQTHGVAATARGAAFDIRTTATGTAILVSDAGVVVRTERPLIVNEGTMTSFDANGRMLVSRPLTEEDRAHAWFVTQAIRDNAFLQHSRQDMRQRLAVLGGKSPESVLDGMSRLSEWLHVSVAGDEAPITYARYANRRLFQITRLIEEGKSGLAFQAMSQAEHEIDARIHARDGRRYRAAMQRHIPDLLRLFEGADPTSPLFRLKQRVEDLHIRLHDETDNRTRFLYARLGTIESSLIAAKSLFTHASTASVQEAIDGVREGIRNVERDVARMSHTTSAEDLETLRGKILILKAREAGLREKLKTASIPIISPTSTRSSVTRPLPVRLELISIGRNTTVPPGGQLPLRVMVTYADGSAKDVTDAATYTLSDARLGSLIGSVFNATVQQIVGSLKIIAHYVEAETRVTGSLDVDIR